MNAEIEAALSAWVEAEHDVRTAMWSIRTGEGRKLAHERIMTTARDAATVLYDAVELAHPRYVHRPSEAEEPEYA